MGLIVTGPIGELSVFDGVKLETNGLGRLWDSLNGSIRSFIGSGQQWMGNLWPKGRERLLLAISYKIPKWGFPSLFLRGGIWPIS
ncbi:MAG: hypothetical protein AAGA86_02115 [Bacteroidota bacterium]